MTAERTGRPRFGARRLRRWRWHAAALGVIAAALPGCLSRTIHEARPVVRIERLDAAALAATGQPIVDATLSNGDRCRYAIVTGSPMARELGSGEVVATVRPIGVLALPQARGVTQHVWQPAAPGLPDDEPFVWFEHVATNRDWSESRFDALHLSRGGTPGSQRAIVPGLYRTDWHRPGAWLCASALPAAFLFDVVTAPVQFLVRPTRTLQDWMEWTESW